LGRKRRETEFVGIKGGYLNSGGKWQKKGAIIQKKDEEVFRRRMRGKGNKKELGGPREGRKGGVSA